MTSITRAEDSFNEEHELNQSSSSVSSVSSSDCPFNDEIASKLTSAFAKATGISIEDAIQFLQEHRWNIDHALKATYAAKEEHNIPDWRKSPEKYLKILSWNVDASDSDEVEVNDLIEKRVETMIDIFLREEPDVILLQQVGTFALTLIITSLSNFYDDESIQFDSSNNCNYISIFTRKSTMKKNDLSIISNSEHWKMLKIEVEYRNSIPITVFNAFIDEHTAPFYVEHINQLHSDHSIISGVSSQISDDIWSDYQINLDDLWEKTGQHAEMTYTFDPDLNSNIHGKERAQRRDRLFYRLPSSDDDDDDQLKSVHMEFEGLEHIKTLNHLFPSTHWAIEGFFQINHLKMSQ